MKMIKAFADNQHTLIIKCWGCKHKNWIHPTPNVRPPYIVKQKCVFCNQYYFEITFIGVIKEIT